MATERFAYVIPGMIGTGDWTDVDERPHDWWEFVLREMPQGSAPFTAFTSMLKGERMVQDPEFYWWEQRIASQSGAVAGLFVDSALTTAYSVSTPNINDGDTLYVKLVNAVADQFRKGLVLLLGKTDDPNGDLQGQIMAIEVFDGSNKRIVFKVNTPGTAGAPGTNGPITDATIKTAIGGVDNCMIIGDANAEGGKSPDALVFRPKKFYNLTQIFRQSVEHTRTAMRTRLRTGDHVKAAKQEALKLHMMNKERANLFGVMKETTDAGTGKPLRFQDGLVPFIKKHAPNNVAFYNQQGSGSTSWLNGGWTWLKAEARKAFAYSSNDKLVFMSNLGLQSIVDLAENESQLNVNQGDTITFGITLTTIKFPFGNWKVIRHPLFNQVDALGRSALVIDMEHVLPVFMDKLRFKKGIQDNDLDGEKGEWLEETSLQINFPDNHQYIGGFGLASLA